jgi:hypothetical protein
MNCEELISYLSDYIDQNLDEDIMEAAREHLRTCKNCYIVLDSTQKTIMLYRLQKAELRIPGQRQQKLFDEITAAFSRRTNDS